MPTASDEQRARWPGWDAEAIDFLESAGYRMTKRYGWLMPKDRSTPTERELDAIDYLVNEWDYGGIETPAAQEGTKT